MKLPDFGDLNVIFLTKSGSRLYGTSTPESDVDMKGVFLPTTEQILLGKVPCTASFSTKSLAKGDKNTADDVDCELYSYGYFLELAASGQTVALEMLWACEHADGSPFPPQPDHILKYTEKFDELVAQRDKFLSKNMKAFIGYAKSQAVKYSLKGGKLKTAEKMVQIFENLCLLDKNVRLYDEWHFLKKFCENDFNVEFTKDQNGVQMMVVCKRALQETITAKYALEIMQNVVFQYGTRSKQAAEHDGADFKALSHAYRIALELRDLYLGNDLTFPFTYERIGLLKDMKRGRFAVSEIMDKLDFVLEEVEELVVESDLPEMVNHKFCERLLLQTHKEIVFGETK